MSEFFTKEELCAYLARKLVPSQLEFQIRKLSNKSRGYVYDRHLLGGYEICFNKNELSPRMIYVNQETLDYEVCLESEESKKGTLPDKFLNLKDDYRKDRFKVLLDVLEVIISKDFSITCGKPEEIYGYSDEYQKIFNLPSYNPDNTSILTSDDMEKILHYCENRYEVFLCGNLNKKEDKEIEEWVIYIEKNNFVYDSNAMSEDLKEKFDKLTSGYSTIPGVRKYKFLGRNGKICQGFLFAWDVEDLETTEKGKLKDPVDILIEISLEHPKNFYYFYQKYMYAVANNPDEFRKLLYILNSYGDEIGFKLVRVITENNSLVYGQQIKKYNELLESEFDALVADGKIIPLTDELYKLKIKHDVYAMADDQSSNSKETDRIYFPYSGFLSIAMRLSEIWVESMGISVDHINAYRYTRKIGEIIEGALRIGELKLHDQLTQAIIEYSNNSVLLGTIPLLCWNEVSLLLNKNYVETPPVDEIFNVEQVKIEARENAGVVGEITLDDSGSESGKYFKVGNDPFKSSLRELHEEFSIPGGDNKGRSEAIWNELFENRIKYREYIKSIDPWTDPSPVITFVRLDGEDENVQWKKRVFQTRISELNRDQRDKKIKALSQNL